MDPAMFGPGSFLGKILGLGQRQGGDSTGTPFGSISAPVEGAPGASVPMPPPRPNDIPQPGAQPGGGPSLGMLDFLRQKFGGGQNPVQAQGGAQQHANQMAGINQIMKTLQGPELKPAQFQPMQLQGGAGGPMQLPPMPLANM